MLPRGEPQPAQCRGSDMYQLNHCCSLVLWGFQAQDGRLGYDRTAVLKLWVLVSPKRHSCVTSTDGHHHLGKGCLFGLQKSSFPFFCQPLLSGSSSVPNYHDARQPHSHLQQSQCLHCSSHTCMHASLSSFSSTISSSCLLKFSIYSHIFLAITLLHRFKLICSEWEVGFLVIFFAKIY